ncbi:MAG: hypothetical protein AB7K24_17845 [Gemmataceae bacterium]
MPISFNCPSCRQAYKVPDEAAGRSTKCRKCAATMQIPRASALRPAQPPAASAIQPAPAAAPAGLAAPAASEASTPPVSKLRHSGGRRKLIVAAGAAVVLVVVLLPAYLVATWLFGGVSLGPGEKYLPDNCKVIASLRLSQVLDSSLFKELRKKQPHMDKQLSEESAMLTKVERMLVAGDLEDNTPYFILELKSPASIDELKKTFKAKEYTEEKVGEVTLYRYPDARDYFKHVGNRIGGGNDKAVLEMSNAFCVPEANLVVQGKAEKIKSILKRGKKPELSDALQAALKQMDLTSSLSMVAVIKGAKIPDDPMLKPYRAMAEKIDYTITEAKIGDDVNLLTIIHCNDAKTAEELRDLTKGLLTLGKTAGQMPKEVTELIDALKIEASGQDATFNFAAKQDLLLKAIQAIEGKR